MRKSKPRRKETEHIREQAGKKTPEAEPSGGTKPEAGVPGKAASKREPEPSAGKRSAELEIRARELETLNRELQDKKEHLEDRLLRLAAEFDNYRKRTAREFQQVIETANRELILQLIDVLDNFQRALDSARDAKDFDSFHKGVELIDTHLREILTRQGLEPIEAVGQPFDPHFHEAVMQVDDDRHPPETVVDQMQPGYLLRDKLLRAPRVVVSRGAGEAEATAAPKKAKKDDGPSVEKEQISKKPSSQGAG